MGPETTSIRAVRAAGVCAGGQCTVGDARRTTGRAANRPFEQTREHDGRIVALDRHHWRDEIVEAAPLAAEPYPAISVDLPARIVHDLRADVKPYGLHLPAIQITCTFAPELLFVVWDD